jgi:hypothetical protein
MFQDSKIVERQTTIQPDDEALEKKGQCAVSLRFTKIDGMN